MARLIDADALINTLNEEKIKFNADVNYIVLNVPTIEAEPIRHGHWNIIEGMPTQCSRCGYYVKQKTYKYCPYCGARMDEE